MKEQELLSRLSRLPREIDPDNDPWDAIAARLEKGGAPAGPERDDVPAWRAWPLRAVGAAAVVALAVVLVSGPGEGPVVPATVDRPAVAQAAPVAAAPSPLLAMSEAEYRAAFREFIPVGESRELLPEQALETIENGWADLLQVETALSGALQANPDDPFLNRRMLELRARQLGFLRQLTSLEHDNRRLTI